MKKIKFTSIISIVAFLILSIFFIINKEEKSRRNVEISELKYKIPFSNSQFNKS